MQNEEWGKDLPVEHIQAVFEAALARPEWYRLDIVTSDEHGIIGWEYTNEEGARRTWQRSKQRLRSKRPRDNVGSGDVEVGDSDFSG